MTVDCVPKLKPNGSPYGNLDHGFNCTFSGNMSSNSATLQHIGEAPNDFYVENVWSNGELFIAFLITFILIAGILKFGFEFFFPKIIRIQKTK